MKYCREKIILLFIFCFQQVPLLYSQVMDSIKPDTAFPVFSELEPAYVYSIGPSGLFPVSSIDSTVIHHSTEPVITGALNTLPGLWFQSGALNTNRITIRGVGYREPFASTGIKVYLDEIPLTNGVGESSFEDIHPFILSSIDVWRGPASAVWGSGLGGMIHLKSKDVKAKLFSSKIHAGSYERLQFDQHVSMPFGKNNMHSTALHYQFINDAGYRENSHYRKHSLTWMQSYHANNKWTLKSFLHGLFLKAFIPSSININDYTLTPQNAAPTWLAVRGHEDYYKWILGVNSQFLPDEHFSYQASLYATLFNADEVRPFNVLDERSLAYGSRQRIVYSTKRFLANAGIEFYKEEYDFATFETLDGGQRGGLLEDGEEKRTYLNLFLQSEYEVSEMLKVFAGLSGGPSDIKGSQEKIQIPSSFYPTAGLVWQPLKSLQICGSVSRGYSAISLDDILNSSGVINPDIIPESGWNKEIGVTLGAYSSSYLKLNFYTMLVENTILTRRIQDDIFEKINGGSSNHRGIETEFHLDLIPGVLQWQGSYTLSDHSFKDFIDGGNDLSGNRLPGTPEHKSYQNLSLLITEGFRINVEHQWLSNVFLTDDNRIRGNDYQLVSAGASFDFIATKKMICTIQGSCHNIFDVPYASMYQINAPGASPRYYYPGKPRSFYMSIGVQF